MRDQEIIGLWETYQQIYAQPQEEVEQLNAAMSAAHETGKVIRKAARGAGQVAREVGKRVSGAAKFAGHLASKGLKEDADLFDYLLEYLVAEGYADTNEAAIAIMANMSEEWKQSIFESMDPDSPGNKHSYGDAVRANEKAKEMREKYGKDWWKKLPRTQVKDA